MLPAILMHVHSETTVLVLSVEQGHKTLQPLE
jgi:hypothetical protein